MTCNVGGIDRAMRLLLGVLVIAAGLWFQSWWGLLGIIPLGTATFRWCPLYLPFGVSTASEE